MANTEGSMFQKQSDRILGWTNEGKICVDKKAAKFRLTASILYAEEAYKNGCQVFLSDNQGIHRYSGIRIISEPKVEYSGTTHTWNRPVLNNKGEIDLLAEGGQAKVFRANNRVIKLYKTPDAIDYDKIRLLISHGKRESVINRHAIFPLDIIKQDDKNVGVATPYYDGLRLSQALYSSKYQEGICTYLNLMPAVLTELHVRDILLSDIHIDNIMIDESGGFALIDVDSAQVKQHITSGWRASSALPSLMQAVQNGKINQHFRLIQDDLFAFYITVFEIFIGIHPLFNLNEIPNFCSHKFIFSGKSNQVPVDAQQAWMDLSITQRAFFFKTFFEFDIPSLSEYHKVFLN